EGAAEAVITPTRVSKRYLAYVAAWSELPRAHVTTARGGAARSSFARPATAAALRPSCARTASGDSEDSWNMRVQAGSMIGLFIAELGHEVVGVAAEERLGELDGADVAHEP